MATFLFDIDMTLVDSDSSGRMALDRTLHQLHGIENALSQVAFAGRTDRFILREAFRQHGIPQDDFEAQLPALIDVYVDHLAEVLPTRNGRVLPGARELVEALAAVPGIRLGLATGNFRRSGLMKLAHFGMTEHLSEGGFGDDHLDRAEVVAAGARRLDDKVRDRGQAHHDVVVIGDTVHDVTAAKANGFVSVAVATGFHDAAQLREADPDLLFPDLSDVPTVLAVLLEIAG